MGKYVCKKLHETIKLTGDFDKRQWDYANSVNLVETQYGEKPKQNTTVKLLYDDDFIYVAFRCIDDEIHAELKNYNDLIYNEEVVEIFIDADCDKKTYVEIEVSPINTVLHYFIMNDLKGNVKGYARVDKVIDSKVKQKEGFWDVEIKIPIDELSIEGNKAVKKNWKFNLYRIDRKENGNDEFSAFCKTGEINFHKPDKFGTLIFE